MGLKSAELHCEEKSKFEITGKKFSLLQKWRFVD
jgi:hypothetical protein